MQRIGNKVSYIKKPLAKASLVAAGLAAVSLLFGAAALALDSRLWPKVEDTARSCAYIELSGQPDFTQAFTGNMGF